MQNLKNIAVGFLVSFLGSIPLGYLNVIGFKIYEEDGITPTVLFLSGAILIEIVVIFLTLVFAHKLATNEKLTKYIEGFSVLFMFILAGVFYFSSNSKSAMTETLKYPPFISACLNFIQIPFWTGWNLYLLNGKYIEISKSRKYFYIFGTVMGTFSGMLALILALHYFATNVDFLSKYLMQIIIPLIFLGLGIFHGIKFYRKYWS